MIRRTFSSKRVLTIHVSTVNKKKNFNKISIIDLQIMNKLNCCENFKPCHSKFFKRKNEEKVLDDVLKDKDEVEALEEQKLDINRRLYNHTEFNKVYPAKSFEGLTFLIFLRAFFNKNLKPNKQCGKKMLYNRFPVVRMLRHYKKEFLLADFFTGITVRVLIY